MMQEQSEKPSRKKKIVDGIMDRALKAINDADEAAAAKRVQVMRKKNPDFDEGELVNLLIKQKCLQTGAVGAITSSSSMIPGLGTVVSLTFGVAADIGLTFKMQAELVLEIAAVYERTLSDVEKRTAVLTVTGISSGATQLAEKAGKQIAIKASERLAQQSVAKAIPVIGVATSSGTNVVTTFVIGRRAKAYFSLGPDEVGEWDESVRALTGVDERKMIRWVSETTESSWQMVKGGFEDVTEAVITVGKATGELIAVGADKTKNAVVWVVEGIGDGVKAVAVGTGTAVSNAGQAVVNSTKEMGLAIVETSSNLKDKTVDLLTWDDSEDDPEVELVAEPLAEEDEETSFVDKALNLFKRDGDEENGRFDNEPSESIAVDDDIVVEEGDKPSLVDRALNVFKRDTEGKDPAQSSDETEGVEKIDGDEVANGEDASSSLMEKAFNVFRRDLDEENNENARSLDTEEVLNPMADEVDDRPSFTNKALNLLRRDKNEDD